MSMTLGKDVSALFPDVLKNIATGDLDQKKLVYLYLMYGAKLKLDSLQTVPNVPLSFCIGTTPNPTPTSASLP